MADSVDFELKKKDDIAIFKLNEKRFDNQIAGLVKGELTIFLNAEDIDKLIFDLSQVEYCDSSGLSAILLAFRILNTKDGHIRLASLQKNVRTLIEISQLNRVLPMKDTVEEAETELRSL
jgi:anti-anti-sigma factor